MTAAPSVHHLAKTAAVGTVVLNDGGYILSVKRKIGFTISDVKAGRRNAMEDQRSSWQVSQLLRAFDA
jgi:hypothetical protein